MIGANASAMLYRYELWIAAEGLAEPVESDLLGDWYSQHIGDPLPVDRSPTGAVLDVHWPVIFVTPFPIDDIADEDGPLLSLDSLDAPILFQDKGPTIQLKNWPYYVLLNIRFYEAHPEFVTLHDDGAGGA